MTRTSLLAAAAAIVCIVQSGANAGQTLDRVKQDAKIVVAMDTDYPPFESLGPDNEMVGMDVDVAKEIAKRLGVKIEIVTPGWDTITAGRWAGRWDLCIGSMTPTKARAEVLDFPAVYYYTPAVLVVNAANTSITKPEDVSGKRIGVQLGTTHEKYLQKDLVIEAAGAPPVEFRINNPQIVSYDSSLLALTDLQLGDGVRLDAVVSALMTASALIKDGKPIKIVGEPLFLEPIAAAIDRADADPEFRQTIKNTIEAMHKDGTLSRIAIRWLGVDVSNP